MKAARFRAPFLIAWALLSGAAAASSRADTPTQVGGVEVMAGPGPKVTETFPANGASVAAGVVVLKVSFDQPMTPDAWAYGRSDAGAFPQCLARPRLLADRHTFALLCTVAPNQSYALQINPAPAFKNAGGRSAKPYPMSFTTSADVTRDMHAALTQAGLTDADEPLMSWDDAGKGISRSPSPDAADQSP
jgi:hypothetical protein